ncbi:MAG TPA: hypothetical protein P5186_09330 [Candidatus Paceibacterota bacterium]|nr:hypothetical protein [Verrucomicrobiota bacterium]HRY48236.1 hypothetical protein [Candidatus Paceibacterota bacterium]HSA00426.1 hypothetical protein [Candidatus Paceibacterota bacterium]
MIHMRIVEITGIPTASSSLLRRALVGWPVLGSAVTKAMPSTGIQ